jgi:hypothetical protein
LFDRSDSFCHGTPVFARAISASIRRGGLMDISGRTSEFHKFSPSCFEILRSIDPSEKDEIEPRVCRAINHD